MSSTSLNVLRITEYALYFKFLTDQFGSLNSLLIFMMESCKEPSLNKAAKSILFLTIRLKHP